MGIVVSILLALIEKFKPKKKERQKQKVPHPPLLVEDILDKISGLNSNNAGYEKLLQIDKILKS